MTVRGAYVPPIYSGGPIPSPELEPDAVWRFLGWARRSRMTHLLARLLERKVQHVIEFGFSRPLSEKTCRQLSWIWWGLHKEVFHVDIQSFRVELREGPAARGPYELDVPMPQPEVRGHLYTRPRELAALPEVQKHAGAMDSASRLYREIAAGYRPRIADDRRELRFERLKVGARRRIRGAPAGRG